MAIIPIDDPLDARVAAFRDIRERDLTGRQGLFVAEGEVVLRVLVSPASLCRPVAALIAQKRIAALADLVGVGDLVVAGDAIAPLRFQFFLFGCQIGSE